MNELVLAILLVSISLFLGDSAILYVDNSALIEGNGTIKSPCKSLQCGLQNAQSNDIIHVFPGMYTGTNNSNLCLTPSLFSSYCASNISIIGMGFPNEVNFQCSSDRSNIISILPNTISSIQNLSFTDCVQNETSPSPTISNLNFPTVFIFNTSVSFSHVIFSRNKGIEGGAIYIEGDFVELTLEHTLFENNVAVLRGGAVNANFQYGFINIQDSFFYNNNATGFLGKSVQLSSGYGGALCVQNDVQYLLPTQSRVNLNNSIFSFNHAYAAGGAILIQSNSKTPNFFHSENVQFHNNSAEGYPHCFSLTECNVRGGALELNLYSGKLIRNFFSGNQAVSTASTQNGQGGAVFVTSLFDKFSNFGFDVVMSDCHFLKNHASTSGGGVYIMNQLVKLSDSTFVLNSAGSDTLQSMFNNDAAAGGALWQSSTNGKLEVDQCLFSNNSVYGGWGGAAYFTSYNNNVMLVNSIFRFNEAFSSYIFPGEGGAFQANELSNLTVLNSQFLQNYAGPQSTNIIPPPYSGNGGAIYLQSLILGSFSKCIFDSNVAFTGDSDIGAGGGAIQAENSYIEVKFSTFNKNCAPGFFGYSSSSSSGIGGAVMLLFTAGIIQNSTFFANWVSVGGSSSANGGAIGIFYNEYTNRGVLIESSTFINNTAFGQLSKFGFKSKSGNGGAISILGTSSPIQLNDCLFETNAAQTNTFTMTQSYGGAIAAKLSGPINMTSLILKANWAFGGFGNDLASVYTDSSPLNTGISFTDCQFTAITTEDVKHIQERVLNFTYQYIKTHSSIFQSGRRRLEMELFDPDQESETKNHPLSSGTHYISPQSKGSVLMEIQRELSQIRSQLNRLLDTSSITTTIPDLSSSHDPVHTRERSRSRSPLTREDIDILDPLSKHFSSYQRRTLWSIQNYPSKLSSLLGEDGEPTKEAFQYRRERLIRRRLGSNLQDMLLERGRYLLQSYELLSENPFSISSSSSSILDPSAGYPLLISPIAQSHRLLRKRINKSFQNGLGYSNCSMMISSGMVTLANPSFSGSYDIVFGNLQIIDELGEGNAITTEGACFASIIGTVKHSEHSFLKITSLKSYLLLAYDSSSISSRIELEELHLINSTLYLNNNVSVSGNSTITSSFISSMSQLPPSKFHFIPTTSGVSMANIMFFGDVTTAVRASLIDFFVRPSERIDDDNPYLNKIRQSIHNYLPPVLYLDGCYLQFNQTLTIASPVAHVDLETGKGGIFQMVVTNKGSLIVAENGTMQLNMNLEVNAIQKNSPTRLPTSRPTVIPTSRPTAVPSEIPTIFPTAIPTSPTLLPTFRPSLLPSKPFTFRPTATPSDFPPTDSPTTLAPSFRPTSPTSLPTFVFINQTEVYPVLKNFGQINLLGNPFLSGQIVQNQLELSVYQKSGQSLLSATSTLSVNALFYQSLEGVINVYFNDTTQRNPSIYLYTNESLLGEVNVVFTTKNIIPSTYNSSWSIMQYERVKSNPLGATQFNGPPGVRLTPKTISTTVHPTTYYTIDVSVSSIQCSSISYYVDTSQTSLCQVCESKGCSYCGSSSTSNPSSNSMSANPQYCVDPGSTCPNNGTYTVPYTWGTCCLVDCGPYGTCDYPSTPSNPDLYGTCSCSKFFSSSDDGSCQDLSTLSIALIAVGAGLISMAAISLFYYRYSQGQKTVVLEELRQGLLQNLDSQNSDHEYIRSMQQALILKDVFVKYEDIKIEQQIGEGSFGVVFKATFRGAQVALKQMKSTFLELTEDDIQEFRKEAYMMSRLRHPNIVLVMGISLVDKPAPILKKKRSNFDDDDDPRKPPPTTAKDKGTEKTVCIITEFLEQGSLSDILYGPNRLPAEVWSYELILTCALQAARGMLYLHSHSPAIIHRDLKSSNLVVDDHWVVKVTDFGMSRIVPEGVLELDKEALSEVSRNMRTSRSSQDTRGAESIFSRSRQNLSALGLEMTSNLGTTAWCAPELLTATNTTRYSVKVDVYSFGMVLWEMWEKKRPFEELTSRFDIIDTIRQGKRPPISDNCPPPFKSLIQRCWQTEPTRRPMFQYIVRYLKDELARVKRQNQLTMGSSVQSNSMLGFNGLSFLSNRNIPSEYEPQRAESIERKSYFERLSSFGKPRSSMDSGRKSGSLVEIPNAVPPGRTPLISAFEHLSFLASTPVIRSQSFSSFKTSQGVGQPGELAIPNQNESESDRRSDGSGAINDRGSGSSLVAMVPLSSSQSESGPSYFSSGLGRELGRPSAGGGGGAQNPLHLHHPQSLPQPIHPSSFTDNNSTTPTSQASSYQFQSPLSSPASGSTPSSTWRDRYVMKFSGWKSSQPDTGLPPSLTGRGGVGGMSAYPGTNNQYPPSLDSSSSTSSSSSSTSSTSSQSQNTLNSPRTLSSSHINRGISGGISVSGPNTITPISGADRTHTHSSEPTSTPPADLASTLSTSPISFPVIPNQESKDDDKI